MGRKRFKLYVGAARIKWLYSQALAVTKEGWTLATSYMRISRTPRRLNLLARTQAARSIITVNRRKCDDDTFLFRYVLCPMQVFVDDILNRFRRTEDETVERANDIDG